MRSKQFEHLRNKSLQHLALATGDSNLTVAFSEKGFAVLRQGKILREGRYEIVHTFIEGYLAAQDEVM